MAEMEELIRQAKKVKGNWRKPKNDGHTVSSLSWQDLLDGKPYPHLRFGKL